MSPSLCRMPMSDVSPSLCRMPMSDVSPFLCRIPTPHVCQMHVIHVPDVCQIYVQCVSDVSGVRQMCLNWAVEGPAQACQMTQACQIGVTMPNASIWPTIDHGGGCGWHDRLHVRCTSDAWQMHIRSESHALHRNHHQSVVQRTDPCTLQSCPGVGDHAMAVSGSCQMCAGCVSDAILVQAWAIWWATMPWAWQQRSPGVTLEAKPITGQHYWTALLHRTQGQVSMKFSITRFLYRFLSLGATSQVGIATSARGRG